MSRDKDKSGDRLVIGGPARANLLPPEVGAAAQGKIVRRNAVALVILAVLVVIAAYAGATVLAGAAQAQLDSANNETQALLAKQADYSEVRSVKSLLATAEAARTAGTSTEIDWQDYLEKIQAILPAGTLVTNVNAQSATPLSAFAQPSVPLQGDRIGELTFTATSASLPDVEAWLLALAKLTGYVDATPGSVSLQGAGTYQVSVTMHINKDALLLRFDKPAKDARDAEQKAAEEKAKQEEDNKQTPAPSASPEPSPDATNSSSTDGGSDGE